MMDDLIKRIRSGFEKMVDHRRHNTTYKLSDLLNAGFAIFSLKDPSLLAFRNQYPERSANLKRIYGIEQIPDDTALRQGLDGIAPQSLQEQFSPMIAHLREQELVKKRHVLAGYTLLAGDGTQHYCSSKSVCEHCLTKNSRSGETTYHHQMLACVWVHPESKTVFPVAVEPIIKQDGNVKNDCELNAAKRMIPQIRKTMPDEKLLLTLDALYANAPLIRQLKDENISFLIGSKGGFVDIQVKGLEKKDKMEEISWETKGLIHAVRFTNGLILNGQNQDMEVNYLEYMEVDAKSGEVALFFSWITDINITEQNARELTVVARCRWKIENETFNTLKNQGYHLEHNYNGS